MTARAATTTTTWEKVGGTSTIRYGSGSRWCGSSRSAVSFELWWVLVAGQDDRLTVEEANGVLDVGAGHAITGNDRPVVAQRKHVLSAHVDHRLDGQHQAFFDAKIVLAALARVVKIGD